MKKSDEQQGPAETSASDPDREGWRQTFDGDLVKAQERFRRVAKLYENTASAAMLNRASFHLVGFLSAEYDMHGLENDFRKELQRERKMAVARSLAKR
jgi:hypothetical protein